MEISWKSHWNLMEVAWKSHGILMEISYWFLDTFSELSLLKLPRHSWSLSPHSHVVSCLFSNNTHMPAWCLFWSFSTAADLKYLHGPVVFADIVAMCSRYKDWIWRTWNYETCFEIKIPSGILILKLSFVKLHSNLQTQINFSWFE